MAIARAPLVAALAALGLLAGPAGAAELRVLSAGATKAIVTALSEGFRQETGHTLHVDVGPVGTRRARAGVEPVDVRILTEILPVEGVTLVGPLPRELQKVTVYAAGVAAGRAAPEAARAFIAYLARPAFKARYAALGLDYRD